MTYKSFFFGFAVVGWVLGLTVHLLAIAGVDVLDAVPYVWMLHIGMFVVLIPGILDLRKRSANPAPIEEGKSPVKKLIGKMRRLLWPAPTWLILLAIIGFYYAFFNFFIFAMNNDGTPGIRDGAYILHNHGKLIRILTAQEYHLAQANEARGFSGHWIAFYGIAVLVWYPFGRSKANIEDSAA